MIIKISGKAHDVFGAWDSLVKLYGNVTLSELEAKVK
jgi:hypothetical protein